MKNTNRRTLRMPEQLSKRLKKASDNTGASENSIVLAGLSTHLFELERQEIRNNVTNAIEANPIGACDET